MTDLTLQINLDADTLHHLRQGNFFLKIYKGTAGATGTHLSVTWLSIPAAELDERNTIQWEQSYTGFKTRSRIENGSRIITSTTRQMDLGDKFIITSDNQVDIKQGGPPDSLNFENRYNATSIGYDIVASSPHIRSLLSSQNSPVFVTQIPGMSNANLKPREKVALTFNSTNTTQECVTSIDTATSTVEYLGKIQTHSVKYDYNTGAWSEDEKTDSQLGIAWFRFFKTGVQVLNDVLNK